MNQKTNWLKSLAKNFQKIIANYLNDDHQLSKLQINIIDVDIDQSLARANVYYVTHDKTRYDDNEDLSKKVKAVVANHFRKQIRRIPKIIFKYDDTYEKGRRVTELISELMKNETNKN